MLPRSSGARHANAAEPQPSTLLFGIQPRDPLTFAAVGALLLAVALAACMVPARRASRVDAIVALREE
jgi:ABC-type lipoprotein release transport system permease subunit